MIIGPFAVDLFTLTHGCSTSQQAPDASTAEAPRPSSLSHESITLLSQQLVAAHSAYRTRDCETSYDAYQQLAEHFTALALLPNARFFYLRCLEVADEHEWAEGQAAAHTNLGESCRLQHQFGNLPKYICISKAGALQVDNTLSIWLGKHLEIYLQVCIPEIIGNMARSNQCQYMQACWQSSLAILLLLSIILSSS